MKTRGVILKLPDRLSQDKFVEDNKVAVQMVVEMEDVEEGLAEQLDKVAASSVSSLLDPTLQAPRKRASGVWLDLKPG